MKIVFINCKKTPFIDMIMGRINGRLKLYETRTRNTLKNLVGERIMLAETGKGKPLVKCSAVISDIVPVYDRETWLSYLDCLGIAPGSQYDWNSNTKVKYLYKMTDIVPVTPFIAPEGIRHGRVWMECA